MPRPPTTVDHDVSEATAALTSLGQIITTLRKAPIPEAHLSEGTMHGLKPKPRHVAALLQIADGSVVSVSILADRLQVSLPTASQIVSDLADLGLVQRVEDPEDRRRTLVQVADAHREAVTAVLNWRLRPLQSALERLNDTERAGLIQGLARLATELEGQT